MLVSLCVCAYACMAHNGTTLRPCLVGVLPGVADPTGSETVHVYRDLWDKEQPSAERVALEVQGPLGAQPTSVVWPAAPPADSSAARAAFRGTPGTRVGADDASW